MKHSFETCDYNRAISEDIYDYAQCGDCGLISLVNVPEDLGRYYPSDYHQVPRDAAAIEAGAVHDRYKIDLVQRFAKEGQLLEIGPAWGAFSLLAKRAGFSVEAIDMDATCCRFLESRIGVRAIHARDEAQAVSEATVPDVVAAWHVLEHLRDPWKLLDCLARHLRPGGIVVLALPNPEAFQFRVLGRRWVHVDAPRHLHLVPPSVLHRRAAAAGLEQIFLTTNDEGSLGWNEFGWRYSLRLFADGPRAKRLLGIAGRVATTLLAPLERQEGRGSAYTAVFRKPLSV
jgi:SAM-dependent methyltransferase